MLVITYKKGESVFLFMGDKPIGRMELTRSAQIKFDVIPELRIVRESVIEKVGLQAVTKIEPKPPKSGKTCGKTCKPKQEPKQEPKPSKMHDKLLDQIEKMS